MATIYHTPRQPTNGHGYRARTSMLVGDLPLKIQVGNSTKEASQKQQQACKHITIDRYKLHQKMRCKLKGSEQS